MRLSNQKLSATRFLVWILAGYSVVVFSNCSTIRPDFALNTSSPSKNSRSIPEKMFATSNTHAISLAEVSMNDTCNEMVHAEGKPATKLDVGVFWNAAKFRPSRANLPNQLNTELNGNVFLGIRRERLNPTRFQSFSAGGFGGIGATRVSPSTTNHGTSREYHGAVGSCGVALLASANWLSYGVGVGVDYLWANDRDIWIYHKKPWLGIVLGLRLK